MNSIFNVNTCAAVAATRCPGTRLHYIVTQEFRLSRDARRELARIRDTQGAALTSAPQRVLNTMVRNGGRLCGTMAPASVNTLVKRGYAQRRRNAYVLTIKGFRLALAQNRWRTTIDVLSGVRRAFEFEGSRAWARYLQAEFIAACGDRCEPERDRDAQCGPDGDVRLVCAGTCSSTPPDANAVVHGCTVAQLRGATGAAQLALFAVPVEASIPGLA